MKRTKKQVLSLITVGYLLLNTVVMSGAVFAETVPSEEIKTTTSSSTAPKESLSSTMPTIPVPSTSSSEPIVSSESKEEKRVLTYEDNQLSEAVKADSATPAVLFQTKELENGLTIQGTVSVGREENQSETILSALLLQRQAESGEWEDAHHFSIGDDGVNLAETEFPFEYSEGVEKTGEQNYRLAADYTIKYSDEDEQSQKGSLEIGRVIRVEAEKSEDQTEKSTVESKESKEDVQESTTEASQVSTGMTTEQSTVESSGPKVDSKQEEPIVIDPSAGIGTTNPNTLGANNQIPKMADTHRDAFQRGLGIMPLFTNNDIAPTISNPSGSNLHPDQTFVEDPTITARYTSRDEVTMTVKLVWKFLGYSQGSPELELPVATDRVNNREYDFSIILGTDSWGDKDIKGNLTKNHVKPHPQNKHAYGRLDEGATDFFKNERKITIDHVKRKDVWYWDAWSNNITEIKFKNVPVGEKGLNWIHYSVNPGYNGSAAYNFKFASPKVEDLTNVSTPEFEAEEGVADSVILKKGTYTGDVNDNPTDGIVQTSLNGSSFSSKIATLKHDVSTNGSYATETETTPRKITGLEAGTRYRGRVGLKDWLDNVKYSNPAYFYTPNSLYTPNVDARGEPTNANNASATIKVEYKVGDDPAHPNEVETQWWSDSLQKWVTVDTSESLIIDKASKKITYELKNLPANKVNYTQVRVKNDSKEWSAWSPQCKITTKGVQLTIDDPTVNQALTKTNEVTLNKGSYKGHVSTDPLLANKGEVWYHDGLGWTAFTEALGHDTILNGTYKGVTINGLSVGTSYRLQVGLRDSLGLKKYSVEKTFTTLNTVDKPDVDTPMPTPTGKYNASANFSGVYGIGPAGTTPAHPDRVEVQISTDGGSTWQDVNGTTTPKLDSQSITTASTKANFTINKMKANTEYQVRYRVKNGDPNEPTFGWSAWSSTSDKFKTPLAPANMEITDAPKLDFGMLKNENFPQTATLDAASQKNHVEVENSILTKGWKLTAKLDQLKRTDNPSILMPWATLKMDINLQNSTDDGTTWANYNQGVVGSPGTLTVNSGAAAIPLWSISDPQYSQGYFRTEIDWTKVTLDVPANQTGMYAGNLVWSLDDTP